MQSVYTNRRCSVYQHNHITHTVGGLLTPHVVKTSFGGPASVTEEAWMSVTPSEYLHIVNITALYNIISY